MNSVRITLTKYELEALATFSYALNTDEELLQALLGGFKVHFAIDVFNALAKVSAQHTERVRPPE